MTISRARFDSAGLRVISGIFVATLILAPAFSARADDRPRFVGEPREVERLVGFKPGASSEERAPVEIGEVRPGIPDEIKHLAEQHVRSRYGRALDGTEAVDFVRKEVLRVRQGAASIGEAEGLLDPEAIIIVNALLRPALVICQDVISGPVPSDWAAALKDEGPALVDKFRGVGLISCRNVLRPFSVETRLLAPVGTGFVVAPGVVMTNRHVALEFATMEGQFRRIPDEDLEPSVTIDFAAEKCSSNPRVYRISRVLHVEPEPGPDVALLKVEDSRGDLMPPLELQEKPPAEAPGGREVLTVGFPFEDPRNPQAAQLKVFGGLFGVKRLSPGLLVNGGNARTQNPAGYLFHDCSTLGGNSGSPVIDLKTGVVYGLHFGGTFGKKNYAWPIWRVLAIAKVKSIRAEASAGQSRDASGR
jgi:S1-C subfamily serine protease